jgi:hypothetical protein
MGALGGVNQRCSPPRACVTDYTQMSCFGARFRVILSDLVQETPKYGQVSEESHSHDSETLHPGLAGRQTRTRLAARRSELRVINPFRVTLSTEGIF